MHKILCNYFFRFCYFPFSYFLGQFVGHLCTEQKAIITTLFRVNSSAPLQKFHVDAFLIIVTFSIFSSMFNCTYIYTLYFVFILVIKLKLKHNEVFYASSSSFKLVTLELFLMEMERLSYCMIYTSW